MGRLKNNKVYVADFETITDENRCRVWAYAINGVIDLDYFNYGNNIDEFMKWCEKQENAIVYFHNLKFDGEFILFWLYNNGFNYINDRKLKQNKTFTTLISDLGIFYSIEVYFKIKKSKTIHVKFYDSLKIFNFSVAKIGKSFGFKEQKLKIDYNEYRDINHVLTNEEIAYIHNDVKIVANALNYMYNEGYTRMTIGSNALNEYKHMNQNFEKYFPKIDISIDNMIRPSYRGGFTYLNPIFKEKEIKDIKVLDVNSLYPSVLYNEALPFGAPIYFDGQYQNDKLYNLYIQGLFCDFKIKPNMIPTIQIKKSFLYKDNEYITDSKGLTPALWLTNIDLRLFFEHYDVWNITYICGYKFKSQKGLFKKYIDYYMNQKKDAKKNHDDVRYMTSKLFLNSLYGKFATARRACPKYPVINQNGIMIYPLGEYEELDGIYLPIGCFTTAYGRKKTIETAQKIRDYSLNKYGYDAYVYSDTDSIHVTKLDIEELKSFVNIDSYELGAWDYETHAKRGKYLRQKCYVDELENGKLNVKCAGLPDYLKSKVTFDNFKTGLKIDGKLIFKHVKNGIVLEPTTFEIKKEYVYPDIDISSKI